MPTAAFINYKENFFLSINFCDALSRTKIIKNTAKMVENRRKKLC